MSSKLGVLTEMLETAMVESGYCCNARVDEYIRGVVIEHYIEEMRRTVPAFQEA